MDKIVDGVDYQVETLKKVSSNNKLTKSVLICFHGLETHRRHDLSDFKEYFEKYNKNSDFEVVLATLYEVNNPKTYNSKKMYKRATEVVEKYLKKDYKVYLLGYSFSCSIVARLANEYKKVQKIVLASPITSLFSTPLFGTYLKVAYQYFRLRIKYGKKSQVVLEKTKNKGVVKLSVAVTRSLSRNRKYFKNLKCESFIFKGTDDLYSIDATFKYIMKHNESSMIKTKFYPHGDHVMVMFKERATETFKDIIKFIFDIVISDESVKFDA